MQYQLIPDKYLSFSDGQAVERIAKIKEEFGPELIILGHHYQRDEVIQFADLRGDSYLLSKKASENKKAKYIVFCGVHFMAEAADILSLPHQRIILPDMDAGCSMADMADIDLVEEAWSDIEGTIGTDGFIPVTYINCSADVKAFCGERNGLVCTSSNAKAVFQWVFEKGKRIFFMPDEHLGRNMGVVLGIPMDQMPLWDPEEDHGSLGKQDLEKAKILLWKGHCQVHQRFAVEQIDYFRKKFPDIKIIVHPECSLEVVQKSDYVGSTSYIINMIKEASSGSKWAVGTEIHLVNRLRQEYSDKLVTSLVPGVCLCSTMNRIDPQHLLWVLENLKEGRIINEIKVPDGIAVHAKKALDRMLEIS